MARDDKYFSFVITNKSDSRSQLRRFTIHRNWLFALVGVAVILVGTAAWGLFTLTQKTLHRQTEKENFSLRERDEQRQQQFKELNERVKAIEEQSRRLAQMAGSNNANGQEQTTPTSNTPPPTNANPHLNNLTGAGGPAWPLDWGLAATSDDVTPEELEQKVASLEKKLHDYEAIISQQSVRPSIWPVIGRLTDFYGPRRNPFGGGGAEFHPGQDIANAVGTPVIATANGTVITAGWQNGYGRMIEIDHGNGVTTRYGHLAKIEVEVGQTITRGQEVGLLGSSGRSTGPHLHYEVRFNDEPVNPMDYLPREAWVEEELKK